MHRSQSLVALFLLGAAAVAAAGLGSVLADAAQSARPVTGEQSKQEVADKTILELIKLLGDDFYEAREAAAKRLAAIGEPALKLLENAALASKDAEVRQRADSLALQISQPRFFFIS